MIKAREGYVFATKDKKQIFGNVIYLGKYDKADNYIEITIEEAQELSNEENI